MIISGTMGHDSAIGVINLKTAIVPAHFHLILVESDPFLGVKLGSRMEEAKEPERIFRQNLEVDVR
jgi:hypothetical protein